MSPLVSVIIPAYNHADFVVEAIASVLAQTLEDFELLVVDDGSTDSTLDQIRTFSDPRITVVEQENQGAAAALNCGLDAARGRYISILNSDDRYHCERLQWLSERLEHDPQVQLAATAVNVIDGKGNSTVAEWMARGLAYYKKSDDIFSAIIRDNFFCSTSNLFFRRELLQKTGRFLQLRYCHDLDFILQAILHSEVLYLDEVLLDYRVHGRNTIKESYEAGSALFIFEVASVIAFALQQREQVLREAPGFLEDLLQTQMGSVLDLVGLLVSFFRQAEFNRQQFADFLTAVDDPFKVALLELTQEKKERDQRPWDMYLKVLEKYKDKQNSMTLMNQNLLEKEQQLQVFDEKIKDLNELIYSQDDQIALQEQKIVSQAQKNESLEARLHEIYNSRGWRWLTRFRRVLGYIYSLRDKIKKIPEKVKKISLGKKPEAKNESVYQVAIMHPPHKNRPRIVHAIANVMTGGSSQLVVDIYEHLGHKYEQVVATMYVPEVVAYQGLPVFDFSGLTKAQEFARFLEEQQADLLHVHYWGECDAGWYRKIFAAADIYLCPVIENINIPVSAYLHASVFRYIFVSNYASVYTESLPDNHQVIYPGSNLAEFTRQGAVVPDDVIGMVYRLEADKLNEDSIEVFIEVVKQRSQTKAYIIGGGRFLNHYRERVDEEGLAANFIFTDYVSYQELPGFYRKLSLFVAPVWRESFGQVATFAMSMELPVVGYRVGGVCEMVGEESCFALDKDSLAVLIIKLLDDREHRLELGQANQQRARKLFSVETMVDSYDKVYSEALEKSR